MTFLNFTFQDPSPLITYSDGQWVEGSASNDTLAGDYSDNNFKVTFDAGSTATLSFVGTSVTIFGAKRPNHGNYSVVLDSEPEFVGDGNGNNIFKFPLWNAQNLSNSNHLVTMTNIPTSPNDKFLDVDFITIGRELGPPGFDGQIFNVTLDDESPFVAYNGSWSAQSDPTASNSSLHLTTDAGSSMSLFFQGSSVELYGLYANAPFQINLDSQLPRQLAGPNVDLNEQQRHPQTLLFLMDGLDESKTHVVTMTNTVSNPGRALYFDFAIVRSSKNFFNDTPSPNPGFTIPTATPSPHPSSSANTTSGIQTNSKPVPVGAIVGGVVGGVGGIIILAFIGFILLRRRSRSSSTEGNNILPTSSVRESRSQGITPFILPAVSVSGSNSSSSYPQSSNEGPPRKSVRRLETMEPTSPSSDTRASTIFSQTVSQRPLSSTEASDAQHSVIVGNSTSVQPSLIGQTFILQEHDAGRLIQTRLPPMYNADWEDSFQQS